MIFKQYEIVYWPQLSTYAKIYVIHHAYITIYFDWEIHKLAVKHKRTVVKEPDIKKLNNLDRLIYF